MPNERTGLNVFQYLHLFVSSQKAIPPAHTDEFPDDADYLGEATLQILRLAAAIEVAESYCDVLETQVRISRGKRGRQAAASVSQGELRIWYEYLRILRFSLNAEVRIQFSSATTMINDTTFFFVDTRGRVRSAQHTHPSTRRAGSKSGVSPSQTTANGMRVH